MTWREEGQDVSRGYLTEDVLVSWLQRFVRHPSEQTDQQENDPHVRAFIAECAAPLLDDLGLSYRFDDMGNLIMKWGSNDAGRSLHFMTYAMTHPAANMSDPFSATVIDTPAGPAVRGRGVAEQKTAMAAAFGAVAEAVHTGNLQGELVLSVSTAGETGRHDAAQSIMNALGDRPDYAVICVGTDGRVATGNKGRVDFDLIVRGKTAHSSTPSNGINAISGAWRLLRQVEDLDLMVADHPEFGPATLTPTAIESGPRATHTVQDVVRVTFDRRVLPGEDPRDCYDAIAAAVSVPEPWTLDRELGPVMYPNETALDGAFMTFINAAYARAGSGGAMPFNSSFALDAGFFSQLGTEAVMMGPGEIDQFHSNEEHVLVSDLTGMARVFHELITLCLSPGDA
jgi:acetylornithine deacetylase